MYIYKILYTLAWAQEVHVSSYYLLYICRYIIWEDGKTWVWGLTLIIPGHVKW